MRDELESRVAALVEVGRHADAADLCVAQGEIERAADLYAAVWRWDEAIALTEQNGLLDQAYRHALAKNDRAACGRLLGLLEARPEQAARAAGEAERKGLTLDAARLREAAGEAEAAAELYERAAEYRDAARARLSLGEPRKAGMLLERRLREDPEDHESALALGRILAQFGRWEPAVRALQPVAESEGFREPALRLLIACFSAMGLEEAAGSRLDALREQVPTAPHTVPELLEQTYGDARGLAALRGSGDEERLLAGRYRVLGPLGAGATGRVVLAHDAFHEREVAIKLLNVGGGAAGRDAFVRFAREARVAAGIHHPNVVRVHEFNSDGPFLVMEHMVGGTLADRLVRSDGVARRLPPLETQHLARSVLDALEAVHRRGVVHRDLKPANVFYGEGGDVLLGDFGVAHLTDLGATLTGAMVGTLAFMAPEQITGSQRPDASTDLYAFAIIVYRCLTGRLPFEGPDFVTQHLEATAPPPSEVAPWLGTEFDAPLMACLEKEPSERPSSAQELAHRLRALPWGSLEPPAEDAMPEPDPAALSLAAPADTERADRFRVLRVLGPGASLAHDELLEREVELFAGSPDAMQRLQAIARADGPYLQAVYGIDAALGRAVLEHPVGEPLSALDPSDGRRAQAIEAVREALRGLHAERVVHGSLDASHVIVGPARAVLRLSLRPTPGADHEADWRALDALAKGGGRT